MPTAWCTFVTPGMVAHRTALTIGSALSVPLLVVYTLLLITGGRNDVLRALLYNGPIAFVFLVLLSELVVIARHRTVTSFIRSHAITLLAWSLAATLLALRLGPTGLEISGHMTWAPLLAADAWIRGFPAWFVSIAMLGGFAAAYLKFAVFGGPSGGPGLVAGGVLAALLVLGSAGERRRRRPVD